MMCYKDRAYCYQKSCPDFETCPEAANAELTRKAREAKLPINCAMYCILDENKSDRIYKKKKKYEVTT